MFHVSSNNLNYQEAIRFVHVFTLFYISMQYSEGDLDFKVIIDQWLQKQPTDLQQTLVEFLDKYLFKGIVF